MMLALPIWGVGGILDGRFLLGVYYTEDNALKIKMVNDKNPPSLRRFWGGIDK